MWRVLWSALLFFTHMLGRSAPALAEEPKEIHVSIRPYSIPPNIDRWAYLRHTKIRILGDSKDFARETEGLQVFVYDRNARSENNCILKQIALSAPEMQQIVRATTRFIAARLTKQAEIDAIEKAALEGIEQLAKEGRAVSREAIEQRAREAAEEAERALRASGGGKAPPQGVKVVHIPRHGEPPSLGASGTPIRSELPRRPSGFRKGVVQDAWDSAADGATGGKVCPTCGTEVKVQPGQGTRQAPRDWDVDHQPPWKSREQTGRTRSQVLDDYNSKTRLECPSCNRSRGAQPAK